MENKEQRVWMIVTIITVTVLVFIFAGITYAFFTTSDNVGSTAEVITDSGKMTINYADGGSNLLISSNISPSNNIVVDKTFSLTGLNTTTAGDGLTMEYKVGLKYVSTFSSGQIHYYIKKISSTNEGITTTFTGDANQTVPGNDTYTGYSHGTLKNGNNKYTEMVTGEFPANKDEQTITFNLKLQFPDTGENQDTEKGKTLNAEVVVNYEVPETISYTINNLYEDNTKDENGITLDGLQKDGTGSFNVTLLSNQNKKYNVSLLNNLNTLLADTTYDEYDNLRYVGATPNNYISFNNELWRIIGIFNVYNVETNEYEKLTKLISNKSLGSYSWDISKNNARRGINEWSQAYLMTELNENNASQIDETYANLIATVRWNTGGIANASSVYEYYQAERGTKHVESPSDGVERQDYWDGKIALMYPSDYGYASANETCKSRLSYYNNTYCSSSNWLNSGSQWTLSTSAFSENIAYVVPFSESPNDLYTSVSYNVHPTFFLKEDTELASGTGTSRDPFIIKMK